MILKINTSQAKCISFILGDFPPVFLSQPAKSQALLPGLEALLAARKLSPEVITGIEFFPGPGSFTGLKVGAAIANALAWSLGVQVNHQNPPALPQYE